MFKIWSIRAEESMACAGAGGYDAEAEIYVSNSKKIPEGTYYVHVNWFDYWFHYTLSKQSFFDYLTADEEDSGNEEIETSDENEEAWGYVPTSSISFIEEFESLEEAQESELIDVYRMLDRILYDMHHGPKTTIKGQAKMGALTTEGEILDLKKKAYYFTAVQALVYEKEKYECKFFVNTKNPGSVLLTKNNTQVEYFDDLEMAAYSEWFTIYCQVKKKLMDYIHKYRNTCDETYQDLVDEILENMGEEIDY